MNVHCTMPPMLVSCAGIVLSSVTLYAHPCVLLAPAPLLLPLCAVLRLAQGWQLDLVLARAGCLILGDPA
jgi:hypothetical protein